MLLPSSKSGISTEAITGPTIDRITPPYYGDDGWPYYYRPHYYDPGWSRGFNATEQLLQCLSAQPFVSCG